MVTTRLPPPTLALLCLHLGACAAPVGFDPEGGAPGSAECIGGKCDAWDPHNDPARLGRLEESLQRLPTRGSVATAPWPDSGWRQWRDGIAWRWQGGDVPSAMEKYDDAFREGDGQAVQWEVAHHGTGQGRELGEWWGHCNGWAAAALLQPEPLHAVEHAGVRFEVGDIRGLLAEMHFDVEAEVVGRRCNGERIRRDRSGRPTEDACRDTNAGTFHVVIANLLGRQSRGFVLDFEAGASVFNHIAVGFEVAAWREVSEADATRLVGAPGRAYPYNGAATRFVQVETRLSYLPEDSAPPGTQPGDEAASHVRVETYRYLLEADRDLVVVGGEWLADSRGAQPDFLWLPTRDVEGRPYSSENPHVRAADVLELLRRSRE